MSDNFTIPHARVITWSLIIGGVIGICGYLLGYQWIALGMFFGLTLTLFNWRVINEIALNFSSSQVSKIISFLIYHLRFWVLVLILFVVIPKTNLYFGIGTFFGFSIPKLILGTILCKSESKEWWLDKFPIAEPRPQKPMSFLEEELKKRNPFEVDPVEIEIEQFLNTMNKKVTC